MKAPSLIYVLLLVAMATWADQNCMQQVLNPADIFKSDNATAVLIGQYIDESLNACNDRCCQSEACNVAVVNDSDVSKECELYACPSTSSCDLTFQAGQLVFVRQPPEQVNDSDVATTDNSTSPTSGPGTGGPATEGPATEGPATEGPGTGVQVLTPSAGGDQLTPLLTTLSTLTSPKATPLADYLTPPTAEMTPVNQQAASAFSVNPLTLTDSPTAGFELSTYQTTTITTVSMVTENTSARPSLATNDSDAANDGEGESYISGVDGRVSQNSSLEGSEQPVTTTSQLYNIDTSFTPTLLFTTMTMDINDLNATTVVLASSSLEVTSGDVISRFQAPNSTVEAMQQTMQLSPAVPLDTLYYSTTVGSGSDVAETESTNSSVFSDVMSQSASGNSAVLASQQPTHSETTGYLTYQATQLPTSPLTDQVTRQPSLQSTEAPTVPPTEQSSDQPVQLSSDLVTEQPSIRPTDQQTDAPNKETEEAATFLGGKSGNESGTTTVINYHGTSEAMIAILISVLALGCVFVLTIVGVLGKRVYDGYQKRHYSRLDYLINGMYN